MTRRQLLRKLTFAASAGMASNLMSGRSGMAANETNEAGAYAEGLLPSGVRSRFVNGVNGLRMHVLEAGYEGRNRPGVLLLHGFPELAYSWRNVMVPLAEAGFHVFAPDQRGYGRTTGWDDDYDGDLASFRRLNIVRDALGLVFRTWTSVGCDSGGARLRLADCCLVRRDPSRCIPVGRTHECSV